MFFTVIDFGVGAGGGGELLLLQENTKSNKKDIPIIF
jgi:hypothetical protein